MFISEVALSIQSPNGLGKNALVTHSIQSLFFVEILRDHFSRMQICHEGMKKKRITHVGIEGKVF